MGWVINIYKYKLHVVYMELKDFVNISRNKKNKQIVLTLRKKKMKQKGISEKDILNMKGGNIK